MVYSRGIARCGLAGVCGVLLCVTGGGAGQPASTTQPSERPTTQQAAREPSAKETAVDRMERAAETLRLLNRVHTLEQTVSELTRQVGGPTRDLTARPGADLNSLLDRLKRDQRHLDTWSGHDRCVVYGDDKA